MLSRRLTNTAHLPTRAHDTDAGLDLYADEAVTLEPGESRGVRTGNAVAIDPGKCGLVWPRSGLDFKHGVTTGAGVIKECSRIAIPPSPAATAALPTRCVRAGRAARATA